MKTRPGWTLTQVFALTLAGLAILLAGLFSLLLDGWQRSIMESASRFRDHETGMIGEAVERSLDLAQKVLGDVEQQIRLGACLVDDPLSLESALFTQLLGQLDLSEVTFTRATKLGYDEYLQMRVAPEGRWQLSVFRAVEAGETLLLTRHTFARRGRFASALRLRPPGAGLLDVPFALQGEAEDPTTHLTFVTPASSRFYREGQWREAVWSDLHYSELDSHLPEPERRVSVTVMKAVEDREGRFVGVLRAGLLMRKINELIERANARNAPHRVFLCDNLGRLLTRGAAADPLREEEDTALRIPLEAMPQEIVQALRHPVLGTIEARHLVGSGELTVGGERHALTFRGLPLTQGWRVGMLVPESQYLGGLVRTRNRLLLASALVLVVVLAGGASTLRAVRRGLGEIVSAARRMREFDFSRSQIRSPFRDVQDVMGSVELAKTALRAMEKYVPVDLVRHLYQTGREPILGGELIEVSLMFTDIKDFTRLSEEMDPNELARLLGRYLEAMTRAIHGAEGVIDKYIGDAVMAVWNAVSPCDGHAQKACRAALACLEATQALYASPDWQGRPPLVTRIGLHRDRVMVGHFGAPDRMSFTALGDGVNLASRLEGLNKQYGTSVLASEAIVEEAGEGFSFRLLDRVAVKGKSQGVSVHELLGAAGKAGPRIEVARTYERALEAYWERDFASALALLDGLPDDRPSRVLAERCRRMLAAPPPADWDGIYVSEAK